jgi:hypothetical protein
MSPIVNESLSSLLFIKFFSLLFSLLFSLFNFSSFNLEILLFLWPFIFIKTLFSFFICSDILSISVKSVIILKGLLFIL